MKKGEDTAERAAKIEALLADKYPGTTLLKFTSAWTLLVATILAAQCTDERVNQVTPGLFARFPTPQAFASAEIAALEEAVHSTGFFRQKAATLKKLNRDLQARFGGKVPETLEEFVTLPGVGRKTANLVLGNAMGRPAVFVDTHVKRVAFRLGLTVNTDPDRIEADLCRLLDPSRWTRFSNNLTHLGRAACKARKPLCPACPVDDLCPKAGV